MLNISEAKQAQPKLYMYNCTNLERNYHLILRMWKVLSHSTMRSFLPVNDMFLPCIICRYQELFERHGQVEPLADIDLSPPRFIDITIRCGEQRWRVKHLSVYTTAKKLRGILLTISIVIKSKL